MLPSIDKDKCLVFDADVIIHFVSGDRLLDLFKIFPNRCLILDKVYDELARRRQMQTTIDNQIKLKLLEKISFPNDSKVIKEYAVLRNLRYKGEGESACMAYCLHTKDIIASSNLSDVKNYCDLHSITCLTTMDFILYACINELWNLKTCNRFIAKILSKGHRLPFGNLESYAKTYKIEIT